VKSLRPKQLEPFLVGFSHTWHFFGWKGVLSVGLLGVTTAGRFPARAIFHDRIEKYVKKTNRSGCMIFS
jgi:hypothetical protein